MFGGGGPPTTTTDHTDSSATGSSTAGWSSHWTSQGRHMEETGTEPSGYTSVGRMSSTDSSKSDFPEENIDIARQHRRKTRSVSSGSAPRVEEEHIDIAQRRRRKAPVYTTAESEGRRESEDIFPTRSTSAPPDRPERRLPPPRRRLTITEKQHRKYQRERARKDAEAAKPVVPVPPRVDTRPQIIVLPGAGGGRAGPPGRPGAPGASGGGGGGAAGAAAAAASSGAAGAAGAARKPEKKKKKKAASGITKAKKRYTDQRKIKMAAMRSLKAKRVREFAARTKKMPKKKRDQARREYKAKADGRYKEMVTKFPPARGLRDMQSVLGLIAKLDTVRMAQ